MAKLLALVYSGGALPEKVTLFRSERKAQKALAEYARSFGVEVQDGSYVEADDMGQTVEIRLMDTEWG